MWDLIMSSRAPGTKGLGFGGFKVNTTLSTTDHGRPP